MDETRRRGERAHRLDPGSPEARARVLTARLRAPTPCPPCESRGRILRDPERMETRFASTPCPECHLDSRPCWCDPRTTKGCHECGETGDPWRGLVELLAYAGDQAALQVAGPVMRPHQVLDHNDAPYLLRLTLTQATRLDPWDWTRGLQRWGPGPLARVLLARAKEAARLQDRQDHYADCQAPATLATPTCPGCQASWSRATLAHMRARDEVIEAFEQWANDPTPETAQAVPRDFQTHQASEAWWRQLGWFAQTPGDLQMARFMVEASDGEALSSRALHDLSRRAVVSYAEARLGLG